MSMTPNEPPVYTYTTSRPPANTGIFRSFLIGGALLFLGCAAFLLFTGYGLLTAKSESQYVFDQFMHEVALGDYQSAANFTAPDFPRDKMGQLAASNVRFNRYRTFTANPQFYYNGGDDTATTIAFSGRIDYGDWGWGKFGVNLRKIGDKWLIYNVNLDS